MKELIVTRGLPASGKTTWAKEQQRKQPNRYKLVDKDSLRALLDSSEYSPENEKFVELIRDRVVIEAFRAGKSVIVHDTNFDQKHIDRLRDLADKHRAEFTVKEFTTPLEQCIANDLKRCDSVGEAVIRKMHREHLAVKPVPPAYVEGAPTAIICDLDGTLAIIGDRSVYDAENCHVDTLNRPIARIITRDYGFALGEDVEILFVSGRQEKDREATEDWLSDHLDFEILHDMPQLFLRPTGDNRKDSEVKREIYENHIKGKYNVAYILDDRAQVVKVWRELGLTCLQVADGDF